MSEKLDTTITVRTDKNTKVKFAVLCDELGLNPSTAINIFMRKVINERGIPFEISYTKYDDEE